MAAPPETSLLPWILPSISIRIPGTGTGEGPSRPCLAFGSADGKTGTRQWWEGEPRCRLHDCTKDPPLIVTRAGSWRRRACSAGAAPRLVLQDSLAHRKHARGSCTGWTDPPPTIPRRRFSHSWCNIETWSLVSDATAFRTRTSGVVGGNGENLGPAARKLMSSTLVPEPGCAWAHDAVSAACYDADNPKSHHRPFGAGGRSWLVACRGLGGLLWS